MPKQSNQVGLLVLILVLVIPLFLFNLFNKDIPIILDTDNQVAQVSSSLSNGLLANYKFEEGSGITANDSVKNFNLAILINGPSWTTGKIGNGALSFDGINDFVNIPDSILSPTDHTVSLWFKADVLTENDSDYLFSNINDTTGNRFYIYRNGSNLECRLDNGAPFGITPITAGTWNFVALLWEGSTGRCYVNGNLVGTQSNVTFDNNIAKKVTLGGYNEGASTHLQHTWKGSIDDVRIYSRALSQSEISELFNPSTQSGTPTPASVPNQPVTTATPPILSSPPPLVPQDTLSPTSPTNLSVKLVTANQIDLSWTASSDSVGVAGYKVMRNGSQVGTVSTNYFSDKNLSNSTLYTYRVSAYDLAGNTSMESSPISTTTLLVLKPSATPNSYLVKKDGTGSFSTIQECANVAVAGDTCRIGSGNYQEIISTKNSGSVGKSINFVADQGVVIKGFNIDHNYINVENFEITNAQNNCSINAVNVKGSNVSILNNYIHDIKGAAAIEGSWSIKPQNVLIKDNRIYKSQYGINVYGNSWSVENNIIERPYMYTECDRPGIDADYSRFFGENHVFKNNYFFGAVLNELGIAHTDCFQTWGEIQSGLYAKNISIERNMCLDFMQGVMVRDVDGGKSSGINIKNNVFARSLTPNNNYTINLYDVPNVNVSGNTIALSSGGGMSIGNDKTTSKAFNTVVKNNIITGFSSYSSYVIKDSTAVTGYNLTDNNLASKNPSSGVNDILGSDPLFVNKNNIAGSDNKPFTSDDGLVLKFGSPAINKGEGGIDIGAYDYVGKSSQTFTTLDAEPILNTKPVMDQIVQKIATVGKEMSVLFSGRDLETGILTFEIVGTKPTGSTFDPKTGLFKWTPTQAGDYTLSARASDGSLFSDSVIVQIRVVNPLPSKTVQAKSASFADVQSAYNTASEGDIVSIPAGSATWTQTLNITKAITLVGAGPSSTVITRGVADGYSLIDISPSVDVPIRISNIGFVNSTNMRADNYFIRVFGKNIGLTQIRIDNNRFDKGGRQVYWVGWAYGVVDHNTFVNGNIGIGLTGDNNEAWKRRIVPGTDEAIFIEDNKFIVNNDADREPNEQIYHQEGARSVTRRNTFDASSYTNSNATFFDTHGNLNMYSGTSQDMRGQPLLEIYDNVFHSYKTYQFMGMRGGSQLIYNNQFIYNTGSRPTSIKLTEEESWTEGGPFSIKPATQSWSANDQINNTFIWGNTLNGNSLVFDSVAASGGVGTSDIRFAYSLDAEFIQLNRDFWMHAPCDGTGGCVGGRTFYEGRQGGSQKFVSGSNAYVGYIPYQYPHPLVSGVVVTTPTNQAPVAKSQTLTISEGSSQNITLSATDADNDPLTYVIVAQPTNGKLIKQAGDTTGTKYTYTPNTSYSGKDSFTFKVNDGKVDSGVVVVDISITPSVSGPVKSGNTVTSASANWVDVKAAIALASSGDTVIVPQGVATWPSEILINKPISVIGAGADKTKLVAGGTMNNGFFYVNGLNSSQLVRISGFYFEMNNWTPYTAISVWNVTLDNLRIDNNKFNQGNRSIVVGGSKGVIDHNEFYNGNLTVEYSAGSQEKADESWISLTPGTRQALFIEDNKFIINNDVPKRPNESIGTFNGGKLVVRYNVWDSRLFTKNNDTVYPFMSHGSAIDYFGKPNYRRGQSIVEIYNNKIDGYRIDDPILLRGSSNLVYNNNITTISGTSAAVRMIEEECWSNTVWTTLRAEWPAEDQVHNTFIWNNKLNGKDTTDNEVYVGQACEKNFIKKDRDYFTHAPQSIGGYEYFEGRNGAAGSYPTDGTLIPYTGTMKFSSTGPNAYYNSSANPSVGYIPFQYPHPLVSGVVVTPPTQTNQTPVANSQTLTILEDNSQNITLSGTDADNDQLVYTIVSQPTNGKLAKQSGDTTGAKYVYTPNTNYNGKDSFTFKVNDGKVDSGSASVTINISAVSETPTLAPIANISFNLGQEVKFSLIGSDVDGDTLKYLAIGNIPSGATLNPKTGVFFWVPSSAGVTTVQFAVTDGYTTSPYQNATITIHPKIAGNAIQAASVQYADVLSAVNSASEGDTVLIPAGTATWNEGITITKGITIKGAGASSTIIINNIPGNGYQSQALFNLYGGTTINSNYTKNMQRVTGIWMKSNVIGNTYSTKKGVGVYVGGYGNHKRVDNNRFDDLSSGIVVANSNGVSDHNSYYNCGMAYRHYGTGGNNGQNYSWDNFRPVDFGSLNFFFHEDEYIEITGDNAVTDEVEGNSYVVRRTNIVLREANGQYTSGQAFPVFDVHGDIPSTKLYSGIATIIYDNNITVKPGANMTILQLRGGSALIFNNKIISESGAGNAEVALREERYEYGLCGVTPPLHQGYSCWPAWADPQYEDVIYNTYIWNNTFNGVEKKPYKVEWAGALVVGNDPVSAPNANVWTSAPSQLKLPPQYHPLTLINDNVVIPATPTPVPAVLATVVTGNIGTLSAASVIFNGSITNPGGTNISVSRRGFQYGEGSFTSSVCEDGSFGSGLYSKQSGTFCGAINSTVLSCGKNYQYRAFATNSVGTSYGELKTFSTPACPTPAPAPAKPTPTPAEPAPKSPSTPTPPPAVVSTPTPPTVVVSTPTPSPTPTPTPEIPPVVLDNKPTPTPTPTKQPPSGGGGGSSSGGGGGGGSSSGGGTVVYITPTPVSTVKGNENVFSSPKPTMVPVNLKSLPVFTKSIPKYSKGSDVLKIQAVLVKEGVLDNQYQTGYFGPLTEDALKKLQCQNKLTSCNGVVDNSTVDLLNNLYNKHYPSVPTIQTSPVSAITAPVVTTNISGRFQRTLKIGSTGIDVKNLQIFLNNNGYLISTTGPGSKGNETTYFGPATQRALIKFQEDYAKDILTPSGLTSGTGYFGPSTMRKVNGLIK